MDEIARHLHEVTAVAPPSRIDLDRLIAADRQRRQHRTWTLAGAGVAAVVAAVAVSTALIAGPEPGEGGMALPTITSGTGSTGGMCRTLAPTASGPLPPLPTYDTVRARPTEPPQDGEVRLTGALRAATDAVVPSDVTVVSPVPQCDRPQFAYRPRQREYRAVALLSRDARRGHLTVTVRPTPAGAQADCAELPYRGECEVWGLGDDGVAMFSSSTDPGGGRHRWAQLQRVDGTLVTVMADNIVVAADGTPELTAPEPLLTAQELVELARAPGLTLYP
ncbi:hypothetical protein [Micromonospora sp. CV4]|uniref:hypothetical protein n=1 Tax=Micromonospora sp. CV4 TaxID=2478711 RepID=UPI000EF4F294|nr:hypothetical protein [Micromonospora sp. CV4]RLP92670.1 hypothetical protein EAD98_20780 [Micromonospora sp. CV4]